MDEDPGRVREIASEVNLSAVQLHGNETPEYCEGLGLSVIKAFRMRTEEDLRALAGFRDVASAFLLDTYARGLAGGTGRTFDWALAVKASLILEEGPAGPERPLILSGGLTPANVAEAVRRTRPYAVDVSSGVESGPGRKDEEKVEAFIREAREAG